MKFRQLMTWVFVWGVWGGLCVIGMADGQTSSGSETSAKGKSENSAPASVLSPESQVKYKEAAEKFGRSDIAGSLETLREMAASDPKMIPPRLVLAQWFSQLKNNNAVRVSLEMATEESPNDSEAFILLGDMALREGELTAAELLLDKAEAILTQNEEGTSAERQKNLTIALLKNRVMLSQTRQRWDAMQKALGRLWKLEGETPETCRLIGVSFFHLEKIDLAKQWFDHARKISPETEIPPDAMLARLYLAKGDQDHAKESLAAALVADPNSEIVLNLSLSMAINDNDMAKVKALADQLGATSPQNPATLKTCGIAALYQEDYLKAESLFQEGLRLEPANMEMANGLALALCEEGDPEKTRIALQHATSNLQKQSNNRDFVATLGWVLHKAGDADHALNVLQQSAADGQVNSLVAYYLAVILQEKGEKENAQKLLEAALANPAPFAKRKAAENLLGQLKGETDKKE